MKNATDRGAIEASRDYSKGMTTARALIGLNGRALYSELTEEEHDEALEEGWARDLTPEGWAFIRS